MIPGLNNIEKKMICWNVILNVIEIQINKRQLVEILFWKTTRQAKDCPNKKEIMEVFSEQDFQYLVVVNSYVNHI